MTMAMRDQILEDIYTLIQKTGNEADATDAARIGKLAIEFRLKEIKRKRMQAAAQRVIAERRALLRDGGLHTSDLGCRVSPGSQGEGEG